MEELFELRFDGTHETERGWFAVIMAPGIDGNFADVYGEDEDEAIENAKALIRQANAAPELLKACESAVRFLNRISEKENNPDLVAAICIIREMTLEPAIAKARGE